VKKLVVLLLLFIWMLGCPVAAEESYDLAYAFDDLGYARVVKDLKWGLLDADLNTVLAPRWEYLGDAIYGFRLMAQGGLYGFADTKGRQVIQPAYAQAENFAEGLAAVKNSEGKWGYIDTNGTLTIPCLYDIANSFSDGLALVKLDGRYGYIDTDGNTVIDDDFVEAYPFFEGRACVKIGELYGYIDTNGDVVIDPQYTLAFDFSEGSAVVKDTLYQLIDTNGKPLMTSKWNSLSNQCYNGTLKASKGGKWGLIDASGNPVLPHNYLQIGDFSEGLCAVQTEEGWGYVNLAGELIIPCRYAYAGPFSEGFAAVTTDDGCGYIDTQGQPASDFTYASCGQVTNGLAPVSTEEGFTYIIPQTLPELPQQSDDEPDDVLPADTLWLQIGTPLLKTAEEETVLDVAPAIFDGHTLLPIRAVVEAIGGTVEWDADSRAVTLRRNGHVVILHIDETAAFVDGRISILPIAPRIVDGRTLIPLRFATEALDCKVDWNAETVEILIHY